MTDLVFMSLTFMTIAFTLYGFVSKYKIILLIAVAPTSALVFELGTRGDMIAATGLAGLLLFQLYFAFWGEL